MEYKKIDKAEAQRLLEAWRKNKSTFKVEEQYIDLRDAMTGAYNRLKFRLGTKPNEVLDPQDQYVTDMGYGLRLYEVLGNNFGFNLRLAADDGIWRFLAVAVIPDIVADRWGEDNDDHFWRKPSRNWLRQLWWYIHLSWAGSSQATRDVLKDNSTDEILNLVERAGSGYNTELCRRIMFHYGGVPQNVRLSLRNGKGRTLFRTIMVMNTAYSQTIEPGLFDNKEEGYVRWLFNNAGVHID